MRSIQRLFFRRREGAIVNSEMSDDDFLSRLFSMGVLQREAVVSLAQRMVDGRVAVLSGAASVGEDDLRELRGAITALTEFMQCFAEKCLEADRGSVDEGV